MGYKKNYKGKGQDKKKVTEERVSTALNTICDVFKRGDVAEKIALATFPPFDVPSTKWSLSNRILMMMSGTSDARGFRQWKDEDRHVKKGAKAFYILGPRMISKKVTDKETGEEKKESFLAGFICIPVFRAEDTEGEPLAYEQIELPPLPLLDVAEAWDIPVKGVAFQGRAYGSHRTNVLTGDSEIHLASPEETVFFHELSHEAHKRVLAKRGQKMTGGQDPKQEIVAETCAAVIAHLVGKKIEGGKVATIGNHYQYVAHYAKKLRPKDGDIGKALHSVLADVEKCLNLIFNLEPAKVEA